MKAWRRLKELEVENLKLKKMYTEALLKQAALVCEDDPGYPISRCGLGFFVDNDSHGYVLYLKK